MNDQGELFTTCAEETCKLKGLPIPKVTAKKHHFYDESNIKQEEHFCSEVCEQTWYMKRLNRLGL